MAMSEYDDWITTVGARRPFGPEDRLGTANHIDGAARRRAAASIRTGECVTLARPLVDSAVGADTDRHDYVLDVSVVEGPVGFATEHLELRCHGLVNTHLDALNHISVDGRFYGGHPAGDPALTSVADLAGHGLFTRGVLADIPAARATSWVEADQPVTADDIERSLGDTNFEPGDALLLYMGRDRFEASGHAFTAELRPGAGHSAAEWMLDNKVSIVCWDFLDAVHPLEPQLCIHRLICAAGLLLVDNCDLSRAAAALRDLESRCGALAVSPIAVPGGTGCNVTPLLVV
jgi:kynurenine formamidase